MKGLLKLTASLLLTLTCQTPAGAGIDSKINAERLGGDERYLIYASTDKPVYREQETLYLRAVILNAADNTPVNKGNIDLGIKIKGPKGDFVFEGYAVGDDSSVGISWEIPAGTAGGLYTALVSSPTIGAPQTERQFEIRAYRAPRLKTQIEFIRDGYGPGDLVQATIESTRAEGGAPAGAKVTVMARVDGKQVFRQSGYVIAKDGSLTTEFKLPESIEIGDGSIAFIIEDGGILETASKTIPILLQTLSIDFYPEGGDLVDGLDSRVYVQARRPDGKPADIVGRVVRMQDDKPGDDIVARIKTEHEGRGVFNIAPERGKTYALLLDSPSGITRHFTLPRIKAQGAVIQSQKPVFTYTDKIALRVTSSGDNPAASISLHKREEKIATAAIASNDVTIELDAKDSEGVLIATVWDSSGNPLAERLVFHAPKFAVNINIQANAESYLPGSTVSLDILTTDENGNPVEATVGLTVTDDTVLELIEKREQAPRLPVMVYLENEVRDLADAQIYLDAQNQQAPQALDLLLGTQGWRRFVLVRYDEIKQSYSQNTPRIMAERKARPIELFGAAVFNNGMQKRILAAAAAVQDDEASLPEGLRIDNQPEVDLVIPENAELENIIDVKPGANLNRAEPVQGILAQEIAANMDIMRAPAMIREYAYQARAKRKANDRVDFTETLYWHKGIRTSARDGKASIKFDLSDSVTSFRVLADAFGRNGALGSGDHLLKSVEPFYLEAKMPLQATVGDVIELPVTLVNATDQTIDSANILVRGEGLDITQAKPLKLPADSRIRRLVRIEVDKPGDFAINLSASAGAFTDSVTRTLSVKPAGFPISIHQGGLIDSQRKFSTNVVIPEDLEPGSLTSLVKVYPSPLANMEEALNALLRQPNGCFEQTSSSNYPLVMAQQYFVSHQGVSADKISQAKKLLSAGYKKLIGFESQDNGYEWFGANPAHEALTAYGLMEFVDMSKVMSIDQNMIQRTRDWLLSRRDGDGGFRRNDKALDSFGSAPVPTTNAYIVWALLESGEKPETLVREIAAIKKQALASDDSYIIALTANILYLSSDRAGATVLARKLAKAVDKNGAVASAVTSITRSGGDALIIETTSLALLAWLKDDSNWAAQVEVSMKWLFERSKSGRFGSTQSTILALKAINAYDAARATPKNPGSIQLFVNGKAFGNPVAFDKESKGAIELPDISAALLPGEHSIALQMTDGSEMPFAFEVSFNTTLPASSKINEARLETHISNLEIDEGELMEMQAIVSVGNKDLPTPIAIIGIPAGLELRHDQLKELVNSKRISAYEAKGRELVLYWRALKADEKRIIPISLTAAIPGTYTGSASRVYPYYTDEHKHWQKGHKVTVRARR